MILHRIRLARAADEVDLSDLTTAARTDCARWFACTEHPSEDCLDMPMDMEPTADEATAIRRRLVSVDAADEAHLYELLAAADDPTAPDWARLTLRAELAKYGE